MKGKPCTRMHTSFFIAGLYFKTERQGVYMRPKGDVVELFSCQEVTAKPRHESVCTLELPVTVDGHDYFLNPADRTISSTKTMVPCSSAGAAEYKSKAGRLISAIPNLIYRSPPNLGSWMHHEAQSNGPEETKLSPHGYTLYTEAELKEYSQHLNFPKKIRQLTSSKYHLFISIKYIHILTSTFQRYNCPRM